MRPLASVSATAHRYLHYILRLYLELNLLNFVWVVGSIPTRPTNLT